MCYNLLEAFCNWEEIKSMSRSRGLGQKSNVSMIQVGVAIILPFGPTVYMCML